MRRSTGLNAALDVLNDRRGIFLRFIGNRRFVRIAAAVERPRQDLIDTDDEDVRRRLESPAGSRREGWVVTPDPSLAPDLHGLSNPHDAFTHLSCGRTGVVEFWTELDLWRKPAPDHPNVPLIDSFAIVEYPVSFLRLFADVLRFCEARQPSVLQFGLHNCRGLHLRPGHPASLAFRHTGLFPVKPWCADRHLEIQRELPTDFEPDHEARMIVTHVYAAFGYGTDMVPPMFDKNGRFVAP